MRKGLNNHGSAGPEIKLTTGTQSSASCVEVRSFETFHLAASKADFDNFKGKTLMIQNLSCDSSTAVKIVVKLSQMTEVL